MNGSVLLTLNPGSSTIKLGLFVFEPNAPRRIGKGAGQHARRARRDRLHCGNREAPAADPRIRLPAPAWLGVMIDAAANECNATRIEGSASKIAVLVIPTDEEKVIAEEACTALPAGGTF